MSKINAINLELVKVLRKTKTANVHLYRDKSDETDAYLVGYFYSKGCSFYPCDSQGKVVGGIQIFIDATHSDKW